MSPLTLLPFSFLSLVLLTVQVVIIMVLSFFQTMERRWAMDLRLPRMAGHFGIAV